MHLAGFGPRFASLNERICIVPNYLQSLEAINIQQKEPSNGGQPHGCRSVGSSQTDEAFKPIKVEMSMHFFIISG